ncbi:MAG TPA: thioredoxin domain-containing protein [Patescibacteria group bacterium]
MARTKTVSTTAPTPVEARNPYSFQSFVDFVNNNFVMLLLAGLFFIGGFAIGSLWTENQLLKSGTRPTAAAPTAPGVPAAPTEPQGPTADQLAALPEVSSDDHIRGNANAKVILVEYSDYECPFCARFHPTMQQVMEEFGDEVAWVYRHYPLPFHPNAQKAAEAGECVAELGGEEAFWNYTDAVVKTTETAGQLSAEAIKTAATGAGVSEAAFTECLDSGRMAAIVQEHMDKGAAAGVSGTPGTFIVVDGEAKELIPGALPFAQVQPMIQNYL